LAKKPEFIKLGRLLITSRKEIMANPKHIELLSFEEEIESQVVGCGSEKSYHYCTTPIS